MDTDSNSSLSSDEFCWAGGEAPDSHGYLAPAVISELKKIAARYPDRQLKVLDLGCGNGAFSARMVHEGYEVKACDHSISGVQIAKEQYSQIEFFQHDIIQPLPDQLNGVFDVVVSLEVIEHLFQPRALFDRAREALGEGGCLIVSTPYHGYLKNIALALFNKFDDHWHPLRDFGHIKFFSRGTLTKCIEECGFQLRGFHRVGRIPALAKSMIATADLKHKSL
ncbi:MAG TPA: class I SAM-dependent methyltransferase [Balneolales bacterium]|nr:class I SAM-dependent methyltransferase [Balneolales bacterium]